LNVGAHKLLKKLWVSDFRKALFGEECRYIRC